MTETYFELEPFEEKTIQGIGLEMNNSKYYTAKFTVQSIGNANISAEISIDIENKKEENGEQRDIISTSLAIVGLIGVAYILYNRRLS